MISRFKNHPIDRESAPIPIFLSSNSIDFSSSQARQQLLSTNIVATSIPLLSPRLLHILSLILYTAITTPSPGTSSVPRCLASKPMLTNRLSISNILRRLLAAFLLLILCLKVCCRVCNSRGGSVRFRFRESLLTFVSGIIRELSAGIG